jgi:hypothetical protein
MEEFTRFTESNGDLSTPTQPLLNVLSRLEPGSRDYELLKKRISELSNSGQQKEGVAAPFLLDFGVIKNTSLKAEVVCSGNDNDDDHSNEFQESDLSNELGETGDSYET